MPFRVQPDDEVHWFKAIWLGPQGFGMPFHARYTAYGVFFTIVTVVIGFEAVTPLDVSTPPVWEVAYSVLGTCLLMLAVDHDKPVRSVVHNAWNLVTLPRPTSARPTTTTVTPQLWKRHTNREGTHP